MTLRASDHLRLDTWPRRADVDEDPLAVWERASRLNLQHAPQGLLRVPDHDEARYDADTQTVLFRRDHVLTTCYSVREQAVTNDHGRAVQEAVEAQFGNVRDSDIRFMEADS